MTMPTRIHRSTVRSVFLALAVILAILGASLVSIRPQAAHAAPARASRSATLSLAALERAKIAWLNTHTPNQPLGCSYISYQGVTNYFTNYSLQGVLYVDVDANGHYCGFMIAEGVDTLFNSCATFTGNVWRASSGDLTGSTYYSYYHCTHMTYIFDGPHAQDACSPGDRLNAETEVPADDGGTELTDTWALGPGGYYTCS